MDAGAESRAGGSGKEALGIDKLGGLSDRCFEDELLCPFNAVAADSGEDKSSLDFRLTDCLSSNSMGRLFEWT